MSNDSNDGARYRGPRGDNSRPPERHFDLAAYHPPGRVPGQDSIEASREENPRDDVGYDYTGYESQMATRIGDEDSNDPEVERLRQLHEGRHQSDGEHSARETERDKERVAQAICSNLPVNSREREHVVNAVKSLNLDAFGNQKNLTKVTLGMVAVLVDEQYREPDELDDLVARSDEYQSIRDTHDISMSDLNTVKQIAREELENQQVSLTSGIRRRDPALPDPTDPDDLPRQYWEELSAESWARIARDWERQPQEYKDAIPDDYRETVDLLRRWEPWEAEEDEEEASDDVEEQQKSPQTDQIDAESVDEDEIDDLDDDVAAEAVALLEQMKDAEDGE